MRHRARPADGADALGGRHTHPHPPSRRRGGGEVAEVPSPEAGDERGSARKAKFQRALERYGVPGVSLLGPLLLPTQFTATMLAGAGVKTARILFWQGLAIVAWTTLLTFVVGGAMYVVH